MLTFTDLYIVPNQCPDLNWAVFSHLGLISKAAINHVYIGNFVVLISSYRWRHIMNIFINLCTLWATSSGYFDNKAHHFHSKRNICIFLQVTFANSLFSTLTHLSYFFFINFICPSWKISSFDVDQRITFMYELSSIDHHLSHLYSWNTRDINGIWKKLQNVF